MKKTLSQHLGFALICALTLLIFANTSHAQTTTFTYQGSLVISGSAANGSYDLQFKLYDQLSGGSLQGSPDTVTVSNVAVSNGIFTVDLDFGALGFPGAARYLEISVRPAGSGSFTTLSPRQQLTSTPYAIRSLNATSADSATTTTSFSGTLAGEVTGTQSATVISSVGGVTASNLASGATLANNATNANTSTAIVRRDTTGSFTAGTVTATLFSGSGSSLTNLNASNISSGTLDDVRLSSSVALKNTANTFTANQTVNANLTQSGTLVQFTPTDGFVAKGTFGSGTIPATGSGVRIMWYPKRAAFRAGLVGGSEWDDANIGTASVALGDNTKASGSSAFAAGSLTTASGASSVAFGDSTTASGPSSVAFGFGTTASGFFTTALGQAASTNGMNGSFVYGDNSTSSTVSATTTNQFVVRAQNLWFGTNNSVTNTSGRFLETSTGAYLTTGGTWTNSSSRTLKTNFATVSPRDVLQKVLQLPIQTWNYKAEDARVRHIGAISQDFNLLFGFGDSAETISTVDADGVALAAIQGLHEELKDRDDKLAQQQQELGQLKQQLKQQQAVIDGMRKLICAQNPQADVCQKP